MMKTSATEHYSGTATIEEIERYLRVKGDKRRELFAYWGLPSNRSMSWSELWSSMGLEPIQHKKLWGDLQAPLLDNKEVSQITGISVGAINAWCNKEEYPDNFPPPIRLGPRKKLWVSLEILAFEQPSLYLVQAKKIRRLSPPQRRVQPATRSLKIDLNPLPPAPEIEKDSSYFVQLANFPDGERIARGNMFQTTKELISEIISQGEVSATRDMANMSTVIDMLEAEIEEGQSASSRRRAQSALRSLLGTYNLTPENTGLCIENFDRLFPLTGWNPVTMPTMTQATYLDYRKRARGGVEKALGISQRRKKLRACVDDWSNVVAWLISLPKYKNRRVEISPIESTLTMRARERGLQPIGTTQSILLALHAQAPSSQRKSLRNAARLIERLQADDVTADGIRVFFPHPITTIRTTSQRQHKIPVHFQIEIDRMVEISTRIEYIEIRNTWKYLEEKTKISHRKAMRAIVNALIVVGYLDPSANTVRTTLENPTAIKEALRYILSRVDRGEIKPSTAATMTGYLPPILERNGVHVPGLRTFINAAPEFKLSIEDSQMPLETQHFCRALIERLDMRADFLLSHAPLRREAEAILRLAKDAKRGLSKHERTRVRQLGTAALFCAIECGGAPIRVDNFLEATVNVPDAWLTASSKTEFRLIVPANKTKNKKKIDAPITESNERYHETVRWFLETVRPHFFRDDVSENIHDDEKRAKAAKNAALQCAWLVPGVIDPQNGLCYTTFLGWFQRHMRDYVGIACDPHNFRHGQASLLYHGYPERLDMIAKRLGDKIETVIRYYAWIHTELLMREGQKALVAMIPGRRCA